MSRNEIDKHSPPPPGSFINQLFSKHEINFDSSAVTMPKAWFLILRERAKDVEFEQRQASYLQLKNQELTATNQELTATNQERAGLYEDTRHSLIRARDESKRENERLVNRIRETEGELVYARDELSRVHHSKTWRFVQLLHRFRSLWPRLRA
jgi:hypothetical protein